MQLKMYISPQFVMTGKGLCEGYLELCKLTPIMQATAGRTHSGHPVRSIQNAGI